MSSTHIHNKCRSRKKIYLFEHELEKRKGRILVSFVCFSYDAKNNNNKRMKKEALDMKNSVRNSNIEH